MTQKSAPAEGARAEKPAKRPRKKSTAESRVQPGIKAKVERVGIVARGVSREAVMTAAELADWLKRKGIEVAVDRATLRARHMKKVGAFDTDRSYDLVVALGGDGTLMNVARSVVRGVPILGVNLGRLGFLTELDRSELYPSLVQVLNGDFVLEKRFLFDVELIRSNESISRFEAFNDAVVAKSALAHIIELQLRIDGRLAANFRADGLIISTPNGATAYNLSAGGPIVAPTLPVAVLTPICPHALTLRPIVVSDQEPIEVVLESQQEEVFLTVDGREGSSLGYKDRIRVCRAADPVHLVRLHGRTFFDSLRRKLKWGGLDEVTAPKGQG